MLKEFPLDTDMLLEVVNRLNVGVYVTDTRRRIVLWNEKAEEITGYSAQQVVGTACWDNLLQHIDQHGHQLCTTTLCPLSRAMEKNAETGEAVLVYAKKADGRRVAVSVTAAPLHDAEGKVIGGIETFRDESSRVANMEVAGKIQRHQMPRALPQVGQIAFDVRYYPRDLVGGDFYDVFELPGGRYAFLVADVQGHGVAAALYTMWLKNLEANLAERAGDPSGFVGALNRLLSRILVPGSFITGIYGVVDPAGAEVTYTNAGHPPPFLYHGDRGEAEELDSHGLPLGVSPEEPYSSSSVSLEPGDVLLAYTDGVTDVADSEGRMLETEGLRCELAEAISHGREDLLERIYRRVLDYSAEVSLSDDLLLLSISREAR